MGLPDARFDTSNMKECQLSDLEVPNAIALTLNAGAGQTGEPSEADLELLVKSVTDAVMGAIGAK
jgi:hypothetical protein